MCFIISDFLNLFSAFLTPIIAIITAYIAYQQWQLKQDRLQFDLFEKRYRVYEGTKEFISIILEKGHPSDADIAKFKESTHDVTFLFGDEVKKSLKTILENGNKLKNINTRLALTENVMSQSEQKEARENESSIQEWFQSEYDEIKSLFGKYLSFKK